jgi:hypothetical protein
MANSSLEAIREKVRSVTGRIDDVQFPDSYIDEYINTFYIYDFPEHLRLKTLQSNYTFITKPNIERYAFPIESYVSSESPVYIGGYKCKMYQDQSIFYAIWPKINFEQAVATGDGVTSNLTLSNLSHVPALRNSVTLSTVINDESVSFLDNGSGAFLSEGFSITGISQAASAVVTAPAHTIQPGENVYISGVLGMTQINGGPFAVTAVGGNDFTIAVNSTNYSAYQANGLVKVRRGTINYSSGAITMEWGDPPDSGETIWAEYLPYVASRPRDLLFFNNEFYLRPIPNKQYRVEIVVYNAPTDLLSSSQAPELRQWWQLLALGASLKIFEDSGELEQREKYTPTFIEQMNLANRRTIKQNAQRRIATPFSEGMPSLGGPLFYDYYGS